MEHQMNNTVIASRTHLTIALLIVTAVTLLGIQQASSLGAVRPEASRVIPYLSLIGLQLLWVRFIHFGLKPRGHSLAELTGGRWSSARDVFMDLLFGTIGFFAAAGAAEALTRALSGADANTAFLLPHGGPESLLWVLVSVTAGVCEEIVFRGYLQRQFAALTGSVTAGILLQAIAFGISHGYQGLAPMAITGSYGLVLGVLAWWRGNVRASALAHAATDIIGGLTRF
jgi:membrane protease YdiL (CAAX protease family)